MTSRATFLTLLILPTALSCAYHRPEAVVVPTEPTAAPEFELRDAGSQVVSLAALRASGPTVVVFFRGQWCMYCRGQLDRIQARMTEIQATGARVVAISGDTPDVAGPFASKRGYTMAFLHDEGGKIGAQYGTWDAGSETHLPGTFVVDREGRIRLKYVGEGKRDRIAVDEVLAALKKLPT